jgi:hypothetical protein
MAAASSGSNTAHIITDSSKANPPINTAFADVMGMALNMHDLFSTFHSHEDEDRAVPKKRAATNDHQCEAVHTSESKLLIAPAYFSHSSSSFMLSQYPLSAKNIVKSAVNEITADSSRP